MKKSQLISLINSKRIIKSVVTTDKLTNPISLQRIGYGSKSRKIYFVDKSEAPYTIPPLDINSIEEIGVQYVNENGLDNDYNIYIYTKCGDEMCLRVMLEDGYNPYMIDKRTKDEYDYVYNNVSEYLDQYVGTTINITHSTDSLMFADDNNGDVTLSGDLVMKIHNFSYELYRERGVPCIKMYNASDEFSATVYALGVCAFYGGAIFTANGWYAINPKIDVG